MFELRMMRWRALMSAVAMSVSLVATSAGAQGIATAERDRAVRRQLLRQATEAQSAGQLQEALALTQRAEQIEATAGTRLLMAQVRSQLGQYVESLASVEQCLREVDLDRQTSADNRRVIRERCEALMREVQTHVGGVLVEVPPHAPGALRVTVNGEDLRPEAYGVALPVAAGEVAVRASVPGAEATTQRVNVRAGATERVTIEVPRVAPTMREATTREATADAVRVPVREEPARGGAQRTLALVAGGVGAAMVGGAVIAGVMFQGTSSEYTAQRCPEIAPSANCQEQYDRMGALNTAQWIGYVGGGALIATGAVLFFTAPRATRGGAALRCGPGPGTVGVACGVRF